MNSSAVDVKSLSSDVFFPETASSVTDQTKTEALSAWGHICQILQSEMGADLFGSWLAQARLSFGRDGDCVLVTPTGLARDWIKRNIWKRVCELWLQLIPGLNFPLLQSRVEFSVTDHIWPSLSGNSVEYLAKHDMNLPMLHQQEIAHRPDQKLKFTAFGQQTLDMTSGKPSGLQDRYRFENFVVGASNHFAVETARRVASNDHGCCNPIFFHGPYGFGKTHLLHAIAWEVQRQHPNLHVIYLTAEKFLSNFVKSLLEKTGVTFKAELRHADVLLIDDVHFIGGKKASQEELFHTLAALMQDNRRVIFSSDRPPSAITEIDERLRSYLSAGLICGIEAADRDLRLGIIRKKLPELASRLRISNLDRSDCVRPEILEFLADHFSNSIRELEGGLNTLIARSGTSLGELSLEEAIEFLRPHLKPRSEKRITIDEIQKTVAEFYGLKKDDLLSPKRMRSVARPRQTAMFLAKQLTTRSYPDIGRRFGGRDHTTVLHAVRRIEALKATDPGLARDILALADTLRHS